MKKYSLLLLFIVSFSIVRSQTAGTLDPSFNGTGKYVHDLGFHDNLQEVIVQQDGKVLSGGTAINPAFSGQLLVMRQLQNGEPDTSFNDSGIVVINQYTESYAYDLAERDDQKLLVAGACADPSFSFSMLVIRLLSDGTPDSAFGVNGFAEVNISSGDDFAYGMQEQPDHKILLAGTTIDSLFRNQPVVVRLNENGTLDTSFGSGGMAFLPVIELDNRLNSISLMNDGRILVSGHYGKPLTTTGQFDFDLLVARLLPDGSPDVSFGTNGMVIDTVSTDYVDDLFGMDTTSDNSIVVSGYTTNPDFSFDLIALKYDSSGVRDSSFGNNGLFRFDNDVQDVGYDLQVQADGKVVLAGTSGGFFFDDRDFLLMRLNADGSPDTSLGGTGFTLTTMLNDFDEANGMAIQNDGRILLAGKTFNGANNDVAVARFYGSSVVGLSEAGNGEQMLVYPNPVKSGEVLRFVGLKTAADVVLYTVQGVELLREKSNGEIRIPGAFSSGFYFLKTDSRMYKIIVE